MAKRRECGELFLGVQDDGAVLGVSEKAAPELVKNFISCISNPSMLSPTIYLAPKIMEYEGKTIIHVHIPPSAEVHSFKRVIYDRVDDADVKVTATGQIAQMYIRKQDIFTERKWKICVWIFCRGSGSWRQIITAARGTCGAA